MKNTDKTIKRQLCRFYPEDFLRECRELEALSRQGWQLKKRRTFVRTVEYNPTVEYRYAVDYQRDFSNGQYAEYKAMMAELNWEVVTHADSWIFLRKRYDPALPEEEYIFYSDEPSFASMKNRAATWSLFPVFWFTYYLLKSPGGLYLFTYLTILCIWIGIVVRNRWLRRTDPRSPAVNHETKRQLLRIPVFLFLAISSLYWFAWIRHMPLQTARSWEESPAEQCIVEFEVLLPDLVNLSLFAYSDNGIPVSAALFRADGTLLDDDLNTKALAGNWCFLTPGDYYITFQCEKNIEYSFSLQYPQTIQLLFD